MKRNKTLSIVLLAWPYLCIIIVAMLSSIWLASRTLSAYKSAIIEEKEKNIELAFERFQKRVDKLEALSRNVAQNNMLTEYFYDGLRQVEHTTMQRKKLQEMLRDVLIISDIKYAYLYDAKEDTVIANDLVISSTDDFYRHKYRIEGYTPEESLAYLRRMARGFNPVVKVAVNSYTYTPVTEYKLYVPLNYGSASQDHLTLIIAADDIFQDLTEVLGNDGDFFVYGEGGEVFYESGGQYPEIPDIDLSADLRRIDGEDVLESGGALYGMECRCADDSWRIRFFVRGSDWEAIDRGSLFYLLAAVALPLLISLILCAYFIYKNYLEIANVIGMFEKSGPEAREEDEGETRGIIGYKLIQQYVDRMISENNRIQKAAASAGDARRYELLDRLLRKKYESREEIENLLQSSNLKIHRKNCVVFCMRYDNAAYRFKISDHATLKDFVKNMMEDVIDRNIELFDTSARETLCLLSLDETDDLRQVIEDIISNIKVKILYRYKIEAIFGVGGIVDSIYEINDSYSQAREVIRYNEESENKILLYSELAQLEYIYYPPETDDKILNYVTTGHSLEAKDVVRDIFDQNFENPVRKLPNRAEAEIRERILNAVTAVSVKYGVSVTEEIRRTGESDRIKFQKCVFDFIDFLTAEIEGQKKSVQNRSALRIMNYVKENFCDSELSLKQISLVLGFHENYISNLFKNIYGENLSAFIEKLRLEKARELLGGTDIRVRDIAEEVGYTSEASFRRAFKKVFGVTPGEYRQDS